MQHWHFLKSTCDVRTPVKGPRNHTSVNRSTFPCTFIFPSVPRKPEITSAKYKLDVYVSHTTWFVYFYFPDFVFPIFFPFTFWSHMCGFFFGVIYPDSWEENDVSLCMLIRGECVLAFLCEELCQDMFWNPWYWYFPLNITSQTVSLVSKRYMRGVAEMKFSSLLVQISPLAPVCLVWFGERKMAKLSMYKCQIWKK